MKNHVLAIDAMGGDNAPFEIVKGAVETINSLPVTVLLVGKEELLTKELGAYTYDHSKIEIVNATEVVESTETPTVAIKQKRDSSMMVGLNLLKEGRAGAFISAGNTGALLTGATMKVGLIKGVKRPALATLLPGRDSIRLLIDCGSNVDSKPEYMVQFAHMGSLYMEYVEGVANPAVALANIGVESEKGNIAVKETYELLSKEATLNFAGNMEARDIFTEAVDVVVSDGFTGNIMLKSLEGTAVYLLETMASELLAAAAASGADASFAKKALLSVKQKFDHSEMGGGAPFLGLKSLVLKVHGAATSKNISAAALQAYKFIESDLVQKIEEQILAKE